MFQSYLVKLFHLTCIERDWLIDWLIDWRLAVVMDSILKHVFPSLSPHSLKLECEKLASEKTEMQRHYVMVSFISCKCARVFLLCAKSGTERTDIFLWPHFDPCFSFLFSVLWNVIWTQHRDAQAGRKRSRLKKEITRNPLCSRCQENVHGRYDQQELRVFNSRFVKWKNKMSHHVFKGRTFCTNWCVCSSDPAFSFSFG